MKAILERVSIIQSNRLAIFSSHLKYLGVWKVDCGDDLFLGWILDNLEGLNGFTVFPSGVGDVNSNGLISNLDLVGGASRMGGQYVSNVAGARNWKKV